MRVRKIICWMLALVIVMNFAPTPVFATEIQKETVKEESAEYTITVTDGTADVSKAKAGTTILLTAKEAEEGTVFDRWEVIKGGVSITENSFVMAEEDVEVKAVFKTEESKTTTMTMAIIQPINQVLNTQSTVITSPLNFTTKEDQSGVGYNWVASTKTLTLNSVEINTPNDNGITVPGGSNIVLEGTNSITAKIGIVLNIRNENGGILVDENGYAITDFTIKGSGSLDIHSTGDSIYASDGGYGNITIEGGTVTTNQSIRLGQNFNASSGKITVGSNIDCGALTVNGETTEIHAKGFNIDKGVQVKQGKIVCEGDFSFAEDDKNERFNFYGGRIIINGKFTKNWSDYFLDSMYKDSTVLIQKNGTDLKIGGNVQDTEAEVKLDGVKTITVIRNSNFTISDCAKYENITITNHGIINLPAGSTKESITLSQDSTGRLTEEGYEIGRRPKTVSYKSLEDTIVEIEAIPVINQKATETLGDGWYVVENNVNLQKLFIDGTAINLILTDGCRLQATQLEINGNSSITVWGGNEGTGTFAIESNAYNNLVDFGYKSTFIINGGNVNVVTEAQIPLNLYYSKLFVNKGTLSANCKGEGLEIYGTGSSIHIGANGNLKADAIKVANLHLAGKLEGSGPFEVVKLYDTSDTEVSFDMNHIIIPTLSYTGSDLMDHLKQNSKLELSFNNQNFRFWSNMSVKDSSGNVITKIIDPGAYTVVYKTGDRFSEAVSYEKNFNVEAADIDGNIMQTGELIYNGKAQTAQLSSTLKTVDSQEIIVKYGTSEDSCNLDTVPSFVEAGTYTVYYKASAEKHKDKKGSFQVTIKQSGTEFTDGIKAYNDQVETTTFNYGDTITVKAKAAATGKPVEKNRFVRAMFRLFVAPAEKQMALYVGDHQISDAVSEDSNGYYVMTVDTTNVDVVQQLIPGQTTNVTVKFVGNGSMSDASDHLSLTVNKIDAEVDFPKAVTGLIYNNTAQNLISAGNSEDGKFYYCLTNSSNQDDWKTEIPTAINAGSDYSVWYKFKGNAGYKDLEAKEISHIKIEKDHYDMSKVLFENKTIIYDGNSHSLTVNGNLPKGKDGKTVTVSYSGAATNVSDGEVTVTATFATDSSNYHAPKAKTAKIRIEALDISENTSVTLGTGLTYNGAEQTQSISSVMNKDLYVSYNVSGNRQINAGNYIMTITGNGNFKGSVTKEFKIDKANASVVTAPIPKSLSYSGINQKLLNVGKAQGGTLEYSFNEDTAYTSNIPVAKAVKEYTVYYKVKGDANHNDTAPQSVTVTISPKTLDWDVSGITVAKAYDGKAEVVPVQGQLNIQGVVQGEKVSYIPQSLTVDAFESAEVGKYEMQLKGRIGDLNGEDKANYKLPDTLPKIIASINKVEELAKPDIPADPADPNKQYKLKSEEGISSVPSNLQSKSELNTPAKIEKKMKTVITEQSNNIPESQTKVIDVVLMISTNGGNTWTKADQNNFPSSGLTVTIPYPAGTGKDSHNFVIAHMFTNDNGDGKNAGDVEYPAVSKTANGLQFTVTGLSPISIGWKEAPKPVAPELNNSNENSDSDSDGSSSVVPSFDWPSVRTAIAKLADGSSYEKNVKDENKVPEYIWKAIKGRNITVTFVRGNDRFVFNGLDLQNSGFDETKSHNLTDLKNYIGRNYEVEVPVVQKKPVTKVDESKESNTEDVESEEETFVEEIKETIEETTEELEEAMDEDVPEDGEESVAYPVEKGNSSWIWILISAVVICILGGGFFIWKKKQDEE